METQSDGDLVNRFKESVSATLDILEEIFSRCTLESEVNGIENRMGNAADDLLMDQYQKLLNIEEFVLNLYKKERWEPGIPEPLLARVDKLSLSMERLIDSSNRVYVKRTYENIAQEYALLEPKIRRLLEVDYRNVFIWTGDEVKDLLKDFENVLSELRVLIFFLDSARVRVSYDIATSGSEIDIHSYIQNVKSLVTLTGKLLGSILEKVALGENKSHLN